VIHRYTRTEMGRIWSEENRFRTWLAVEVAATETLAEVGWVPKSAARTIKARANFKLERIQEIEAEVRHDVIAFTTAVSEFVGPDSRWFHYGLTSNDVVDTAQALLITQASKLIDAGIVRLAETLEKRAWEFKDTPQIGRTHGVHAEPITFGLKLANWYAETQRNLARFRHAAEDSASAPSWSRSGATPPGSPRLSHGSVASSSSVIAGCSPVSTGAWNAPTTATICSGFRPAAIVPAMRRRM